MFIKHWSYRALCHYCFKRKKNLLNPLCDIASLICVVSHCLMFVIFVLHESCINCDTCTSFQVHFLRCTCI